MIKDNLILSIIHELKTAVGNKEKDVSRALITDLYAHGRLQGSLDGLEEALGIIDRVLTEGEE